MANETEIVEVRLPLLPKGYRYTGEYRYATEGEYIHLAQGMIVWDKEYDTVEVYHIIEKIEWVPSVDETFFCVSYTADAQHMTVGSQMPLDIFIEAGNYFKTQRLARNAADAMKAMFKELPHE